MKEFIFTPQRCTSCVGLHPTWYSITFLCVSRLCYRSLGKYWLTCFFFFVRAAFVFYCSSLTTSVTFAFLSFEISLMIRQLLSQFFCWLAKASVYDICCRIITCSGDVWLSMLAPLHVASSLMDRTATFSRTSNGYCKAVFRTSRRQPYHFISIRWSFQ